MVHALKLQALCSLEYLGTCLGARLWETELAIIDQPMEHKHNYWRFNQGDDDFPSPDRDTVLAAINHFEREIRPLNEREKNELFDDIYNECTLFISYEHGIKTAPRQKEVTRRLEEISEASLALKELIEDSDHFTLLELYRSGLENGPVFGALKKLGFNELANWRRLELGRSVLLAALDELDESAQRAADNQPEDRGGRGSLVPGNAVWDLCVGCATAFETLGVTERISGSVDGPFGTFVTLVYQLPSELKLVHRKLK